MGCCYSGETPSAPSSSSNLLNGPQRKYVEESGVGDPMSARQFRPPDNKSDTLSDDDEILGIIKMKPLVIDSLNKTFQDQEKLYNEVSDNYHAMRKEMHNFKSGYLCETSGIPELQLCIRTLVQRCGTDSIENVQRKAHGVYLIVSEQTVLTNSTVDPQEVLESIKHFNNMNKHLEKVLDRCQCIQKSINLLLQDEETVRLQITKEPLTASEGTEAIRNCIENFKLLQQMRKNLEFMKTKCQDKLKEIVEGSKVFFENKK